VVARDTCPIFVPLTLNGWYFNYNFCNIHPINYMKFEMTDPYGSCRHWGIFLHISKGSVLFLNKLQLDVYFCHSRGSSFISTPNYKFEGQNWETRSSSKVIHKPMKRFLKIIKCPPSTCAQNALPLHKWREHNFFLPKMQMVEKRYLQVRRNGKFLLNFIELFLHFSTNQTSKYPFSWHFLSLFFWA